MGRNFRGFAWRSRGGSNQDAAEKGTREYRIGSSINYWHDATNELTNRVETGVEQTYYAYDENGSLVTEHKQTAAETTYFEYEAFGCGGPASFV